MALPTVFCTKTISADYKRILADQDNLCAICHRPPREGQALHVDNDHVTDAVRAMLCDTCNRGIGYFGEDPAYLRSAAMYVERYAKGVI